VEYAEHMKESRNACRILVGKSKGKKSIGRHRHIWEGNIKMDLMEIGFGVWIGLLWFRIRTSGGLL
jgi:hypothetical protein